MFDGKHRAIEELTDQYRKAMSRATSLRSSAVGHSRTEQANEYIRQAQFEEDKARGYLKHAEILAELDA